jgi:hypothetical protein
LEQESSPAQISEQASKALAGPKKERAMEIDGLEKEWISKQREEREPAKTQLDPQAKPV